MGSLQLGTSCIQRDGSHVYIIAEIGQNHQGSLEIAKQSALRRKYDGANSWGRTYGEHKAFLEFSLEQYLELQQYSNSLGIDFTASAMDEVSLAQLNDMDVPFIKIGSGDSNNFLLLEKAAKLKIPILISTGMQTSKCIERIVQIMRKAKKTNYGILHCVSSYPTKPEDCQLKRISLLRAQYPHVVIGYSGHEIGLEISKAAVLMGARIIERHFTLDNTLKGSDHKCSLQPKDMSILVSDIKELMSNSITKTAFSSFEIISILGDSSDVKDSLNDCDEYKVLAPCEISCRNKLGKSLVAKRILNTGHVISADDIKVKVSEPHGIWAEHLDDVIGKQLLIQIEADEPLQWEHISNFSTS
ncbi:N-acetylneuraminic acid synthase isoform X2 [Haematobia irritans]|uniref:N-acetylneuraminic acid synthase isoform X2 n=1 Tax=Haematobia irritans TaxID=7368 RepID=UPI003F503A51